MKSADMMRLLLLVVLMISLVGCAELQRRLHYDNLDEVARDATGKELWEMAFGDKEVRQVRDQLGKVKTTSLYCIRDNVNAGAYVPEGLSEKQEQRRARNIKLLAERALAPVIDLREQHAQRQIIRSGCNQRR